ncbi:MAG: type II secretion system protein [Verrucomicrobia bacterium]|nr:type II secretion system protein [Verrucomicrobiota bacterium]
MDPFRHDQHGVVACRCPAAQRPAGFSLIELLITMALIIVLYVLYFSRSAQHRQNQLKAQCAQNLQHIHVALQTYTLENRDAFPVVKAAKTSEPPLSLLVPKYTSVTAPFICPGPGGGALPEAKPFADRRISYAYYMGQTAKSEADQPLVTDAQVNTQSKTQGAPLFSRDGEKPGNNHHRFGGNVMFCDGRIEESKAKAAFALVVTGKVVLLNSRP